MRADTGYRPDIDGLRAVAVTAVILYHAGVDGLSGGFVGVDVFFVISGFLITRWLDARGARPLGPLLREFYVRRARRILPALLLVLAVATPVAIWLLEPVHLQSFGQMLAPAAIMLGNFGAWRNGGYFGWNASDMPLLHLWSIAVEEQFYLLYPLLLVFLSRRLPRWRVAGLCAGALLSFALCVWASREHGPANYYLLPTRAWELLVGALVALGFWPRIRARLSREVATLLALAISLAACGLYGRTLAYPGLWTLLPVLATAQILAAGEQGGSLTGQLLSWQPLVFTGLVSYSLYLWHMPLLGLFRYWNIFQPDAGQVVGLCTALYLLAVVTWRYVELPIRRRTLLPVDRWFWYATACASLTLFVIGSVIRYQNGMERRMAEIAAANPGVDVVVRQRAARCMGVDLEQIRRGALCRFGPGQNARGRVVVWGDSHTWALVAVYKELAERERLQIYIAQYPACRPLIGVVNHPGCVRFNAAMLEAVSAFGPGLVILNSYWNSPIEALAVNRDLAIAGDESLFSRGLQETLRRVRAPGRQVCVVKTVPRLPYPGEYAMFMARKRGIGTDFLALPRAAAYAQDRALDADVDSLAARGLLISVDPKRVLCAGERCRYRFDDGGAIYMDDNHLSLAGAELMRDEIAGCFTRTAQSQLVRAHRSASQ